MTRRTLSYADYIHRVLERTPRAEARADQLLEKMLLTYADDMVVPIRAGDMRRVIAEAAAAQTAEAPATTTPTIEAATATLILAVAHRVFRS